MLYRHSWRQYSKDNPELVEKIRKYPEQYVDGNTNEEVPSMGESVWKMSAKCKMKKISVIQASDQTASERMVSPAKTT